MEVRNLEDLGLNDEEFPSLDAKCSSRFLSSSAELAGKSLRLRLLWQDYAKTSSVASHSESPIAEASKHNRRFCQQNDGSEIDSGCLGEGLISHNDNMMDRSGS